MENLQQSSPQRLRWQALLLQAKCFSREMGRHRRSLERVWQTSLGAGQEKGESDQGGRNPPSSRHHRAYSRELPIGGSSVCPQSFSVEPLGAELPGLPAFWLLIGLGSLIAIVWLGNLLPEAVLRVITSSSKT